MFMKAILHNKEDDLHFLLKCLVDEIDEGLLLKEDKFEEADKKLQAAREKDEETAARTEEEVASYVENTMGEKVADKDEENKMVEAYNKMYGGFLNYVKDRFSDKEVIERYEGTEDDSGKKIKGRIQLLKDELDKKTPLREGSRKAPLTDAQKENYKQQIEGMEKEVANAKKNIADKKAREEKALKDIEDGKDLVIDLGSDSQFKPLTIPNADVVRALNEYKKTAKVKAEAKDIRPPKASTLEGLETLAGNPTKRLKELLGDKKVKDALGDKVELGTKTISDAFIEAEDKGKALEAYDRALGLIQTELKNLKKLKTKTTTKNKIEELDKKVKDLQGLYNTFQERRNNIREDKGDRSVTPMSTTKRYYNDLKKAIEDFRASVITHKDNSNRIRIAAKKHLDSTNLGDFQTVLAVINVMKGSEVRADKLQEAEKRKAKLKTEIEGLKGQGRKTSTRNKLVQEFESTIREIQELHQLKDIKEGKIEEGRTPTAPSKQGKTMSDRDFREALVEKPTSIGKIKEQIEQELKLTYDEFKAEGEKKRKEAIRALDIAFERKEKNDNNTEEHNKNKERINLYYSDDDENGSLSEKNYNQQKKKAKARLEEIIEADTNPKFPKAEVKKRLKKQDTVDAFLRYDINKDKKLVLRDVPFDEESKDYATIKKTIDEILQLLQKEVKGFDANLETVIKSSFDYNEPDISEAGKEKRKKLKEKLQAKRRGLRGKRAGKEQIKATLPANLIKQLADLEDDISDLVIEYLTKMFPNFTLSLKIPQVMAMPKKAYNVKGLELRAKEYKKFLDEGLSFEDMKGKLTPLVLTPNEDKSVGFKLQDNKISILANNGDAKKNADNYAKSSVAEHFRIFPTLIDENDKQKPNSLAVQELWGGLIDNLNQLSKLSITKKEKEDVTEFIKEYEENLEEKFKAFKGAKTDLLKFFEAITKFAEDYEKLADEYDKVVVQMKGGKGKTGKTLEKELRTKWDAWMKTNEGKELPLNFMGVEIKDSDLKDKTISKEEKEKTPLDFFIERMSRTLEIIREYYRRAKKVDEGQRPTKEEVTSLENDIMSTIKQTESLDSTKEIFLTKEEREDIMDGLVHLKKEIGLPTQSEKSVDNLIDLEQAYENALSRLTTKETEESTIKPSTTEQKGTPPSAEELQAWFENWLKRELKFSNKKDLKGDKKNLQSKAKELEERLVGLLEVFFVNIKKSSIVEFKNKLKIQDYKRNPQSLRRILLTKTVSDSKAFDNVADLESLMKQFMGLDEKLKKEMDLNRILAELDKIEILADFSEESFGDKIEAEILEEIRAEKEEGK